RALIERDPWLADAVQVRRWDDRAKDSAAAPPRLSHYRELLERCLGPQSWEGL
ncbi:MAG: phosphohydrolase, partial [Candidatus Rokubacteria bacterium]|nr:phosphohydrolase [Candidatus Rokubacteria bacterium]